MRRFRALAVGLAGAVLALASCDGTTAPDESLSPDGDRATVIAHGLDRYPTRTASDWVTHADHVVVATAVAETELPATAEEQDIGEGYIPRRVTLRVDQAVWSSAAAERPVPEGTFEWNAPGWTFAGAERTRMAVEDQPRLEVGHTYIVALTWQPAVDDGGEEIPARWGGLGSDAVVPYDDGILGRGELAGEQQREAAPLDPSDPEASLEDQLAGQDADALAAALDAASS